MTDAIQPNETLQSQLSAFLDDELPNAETDLLVRRLIKDRELKQTMARYLMAGEALRNTASHASRVAALSPDFSKRIAMSIRQEQAIGTKEQAVLKNSPWSKWLKPAAGMALASGVAALAFVSLRSQSDVESGWLAAGQLQPAMQGSQPSYRRVNAVTHSAPISEARLANYVVAHSEFSSPLGRGNQLTGLLTSEQQGYLQIVNEEGVPVSVELIKTVTE